MVSLYISDCPGTWFVEQSGLICLLLKHFKPKEELKKKTIQETIMNLSPTVTDLWKSFGCILCNVFVDYHPYSGYWLCAVYSQQVNEVSVYDPSALASEAWLPSPWWPTSCFLALTERNTLMHWQIRAYFFLDLLKVAYPPWEYRWTEKMMVWYLDLWGRIWPWLNWSSRQPLGEGGYVPCLLCLYCVLTGPEKQQTVQLKPNLFHFRQAVI